MNGRQIHRLGTRALSLLMVAIGVGLVVEVVIGQDSLASPRMLLGALFVAAGAGRLYVEARRGRGA